MRPSEFEAIRPHLQKAFDDADGWLKKQQAWQNAAKSWLELPEDKRPKANLLTRDGRKALEAWERGTLTEEKQKAAEREIQSFHDPAPPESTYPPWRHSSKQAAAWLRKVDWTAEADGIDLALSGLPRGPVDGNNPDNMARQFDAIRAGAERVKAILTTCLTESADSPGTAGDLIERLLAGPDDAELTPRELARLAAEVKQPSSLSAVQGEKRAAGESKALAKRDKLKRILDFNRGLQAAADHDPGAEPAADADNGDAHETGGGTLKAKKSKRSTERGEGQAKLIAALTKHHNYANGSCLNTEPIGNNELARLAEVSDSTASAFFTKEFGGHTKYRALCVDATRLVASLKLLNQEYSPHHLFGGKPPDEDDRDTES
ncbi:MAG: hypothetical protein ABSG68_11235 [Thermoguttaceae bacterium]